MTDPELLEAAARAAGVDAEWHNDDDAEFDATHEGMFLRGCRGPSNSKYWNPLTDDGDALRLAVALRITVQFPWDDNCRTLKETHCWTEADRPVEESHGADPAAATRRAIVRAAAALAKDTA